MNASINKEKFLKHLATIWEHSVKEFEKYWRHGESPDTEKEEYYTAVKGLVLHLMNAINDGGFDD